MELPLKVLKKTSEVNRTNIKLKKSTKQIFVEDFFFFIFIFGFVAQLLGSYWAHTRDQIWVLGSKQSPNHWTARGFP